MFDALLHGRVDTEGLNFEAHLADIEQLNATALSGGPDVTKISYAVLPLIAQRYRVLSSGSALGRGNGPLLVSSSQRDSLKGLSVAIPGVHTTANLLLEKLFPEMGPKIPMLFSDIAPAVQAGGYDAGVLIHEGRFTYRSLGLELVADLGLEWEARTGLPLPLGAIAVSRRLPLDLQKTLSRVLRRSIEYGFAHREASAEFVRSHARELSEEVIRQHIDLFVNDYSLELGPEGRRAVQELLNLKKEVFV